MRKSLIYLLLAGAIPFTGMHDAFAQRGSTKTITTTRLAGVRKPSSTPRPSASRPVTKCLSLRWWPQSRCSPGTTTANIERATFTGSARQDVPAGLAGNEYLVGKLMDGRRVAAIDVDLLKAQATYDFAVKREPT